MPGLYHLPEMTHQILPIYLHFQNKPWDLAGQSEQPVTLPDRVKSILYLAMLNVNWYLFDFFYLRVSLSMLYQFKTCAVCWDW